MIKYKIKDKGFVIKTNNTEIRTPCTITDKNYDINKINLELRSNGIQTYEEELNLDKNELVRLGCKKDLKDSRDFKFLNIVKSKYESSLPNRVNYTQEMTPVKDQGQLGSCVGFAVASMKEWQEKKEYLKEIKQGSKYRRKESSEYNLSEQWIYYKSKEIDPWPNQEGTSIRCALKQLQKFGVPPEHGWGYNDRRKGKPDIWTPMISKWYKGGKYFRVSFSELEKCLYEYGPIPIGIICFEEIFDPKRKGTIPYPKNPNNPIGGHAICLTAYNRKKQRFKFKNSWGYSWGIRGFGYISYQYLKDFMMDAWVMIDIDVNKV